MDEVDQLLMQQDLLSPDLIDSTLKSLKNKQSPEKGIKRDSTIEKLLNGEETDLLA